MGADADTLNLLHRALQLTVTPVIVTAPPVPLVDVIVKHYEGSTDKNGVFEGFGTALFELGNRYQGQWVGGKMHGHGTYAWADGIMYAGDFHYNKCTGKGKMSWPDGSDYDGDVIDGVRHGFGTLLVPGPDGQAITYTGQWSQGVRHGSGKISYDFMGSRWYEGLWKNDLRDGHGEMHFASGAHYKGDWVLNVKCGFGTMVWANERESYFGQWKDDKPHGEGTYLYQVLLPGTAEASKAASLGRGGGAPETSILELAPQMHGINRYIGQFEKGLRQGHGTFFYADGARYEGQWNGNQKHGMGRFIYEDGSVYEGPFDRDRPVKPTQPVSTHGLVKLTCDDLLADEPDPEDVARALSNLLLRGASDLREIYRSAADPPSADAVEWTLRPEMFGKLMRQSGALSPFLPLSEAMAAAEPAFDGAGRILFWQFLNALIRVAHARFRGLPRLDDRFAAFLNDHVLPALRGDGMDDVARQVEEDPDVLSVFQDLAHLINTHFPTRPEGTTVRHVVAKLKALGVLEEPSEEAPAEGAQTAEGEGGEGAPREGGEAGAAAGDAAASAPEEAPTAAPTEGDTSGAVAPAAAADAAPFGSGAEGGPLDGEDGGAGGNRDASGEAGWGADGQTDDGGPSLPYAEPPGPVITYPRRLSLAEAVQVVMAACYGGQAKDSLDWAHQQQPVAPPPVNHFMLSGTVEPLQVFEIVARVADATQNSELGLAGKIILFLQSLSPRRVTIMEEESAPAVVPAMLGEIADGAVTANDTAANDGRDMQAWPGADTPA